MVHFSISAMCSLPFSDIFQFQAPWDWAASQNKADSSSSTEQVSAGQSGVCWRWNCRYGINSLLSSLLTTHFHIKAYMETMLCIRFWKVDLNWNVEPFTCHKKQVCKTVVPKSSWLSNVGKTDVSKCFRIKIISICHLGSLSTAIKCQIEINTYLHFSDFLVSINPT